MHTSKSLEFNFQDFIATSSALMVGFVDAIAALKLQFRINEFVASGSSNDYCWRMRIIGCVQDDGIISEAPVLPSSTTTFSTSSSSNSSHTATSSVCSAATTTVIVLPSRGSSVAVPPSCGVENGAPVSRPSSGAAGLLGGGAAVLVLGVVLIVIAVILCVVGLVIIKRKKCVNSLYIVKHYTCMTIYITILYAVQCVWKNEGDHLLLPK